MIGSLSPDERCKKFSMKMEIPLDKCFRIVYNKQVSRRWRHGQAVRQGSAKPLFPSSILGGASNENLILYEWGSFLFKN